MNVPVHVIANFNPLGKIKPLYIWIEDEEQKINRYKIEKIENIKEERYSGMDMLLFSCTVLTGDYMKQIFIRYTVETHKWMLVDN